MKKTLLFLLSVVVTFTIAQVPYNHNIDGKCNHQHHFEQSFKSTNDITHVADIYDMHFVHLNLEVESTSTAVAGSALMEAKVISPTLDTIYMELNQSLSLDSMRFNGALVSPTFTDSEIFLVVDEMIEGDDISVLTYYHGEASSGGFFSGITSDYNNTYGKNVTWTLSEPFSARDWWPVRQNLNDKIDSVYQYYTCENTEMVGSNGLLTEVVDNGNFTKTYKWETYYPVSYYLMSFSVSEYQDYSIYAKPAQLEGDSILIQNFIYDHPNCLPNNKSNIDKSTGLMELFSELYGLYPFHEEKYGNCLAEIGGGMEHQTMSTMGSFDFGLNAHEMGHQWYGDNVTCATWSDIWINEGFASYSEYLAAQYLQSQNSANSWMNSAHNYIKNDPDGSVYVPENEVYYGNEWRIFDGRLTYKKGAAILHSLRYLINDDELFFAAMQNYSEEYTDQIATGMDYKNSMSAYTGINLDSYFEQWYFGQGYPIYSVEYSYNDIGLFLSISQTTSSPFATAFFDLPLELKLNFGAGQDSIIRVPITSSLEQVQTEITQPIILVGVDPNNWIINEVGTITVGTSELQNELGLVVGPNPVRNDLQIIFDKASIETKEVSLLDLSGRVLRMEKTIENLNIDVSDLSSGTYIVRVNDGKSMISRKVLKR